MRLRDKILDSYMRFRVRLTIRRVVRDWGDMRYFDDDVMPPLRKLEVYGKEGYKAYRIAKNRYHRMHMLISGIVPKDITPEDRRQNALTKVRERR